MNLRQEIQHLTPEQNLRLQEIRTHRNFNPEKYLAIKIRLLNSYFSKNNLKGAIVAVSGGIDSALVLAIVKLASEQGIIEKIIPITLPAYGNRGVTNQKETVTKAEILCQHLGLELIEMPIEEDNYNYNFYRLKENLNSKNSDWAEGQFVPYFRTPHLCSAASIAADAGFPSIIVGTTNRDEGAYLGYVGKFSDGAVDIQLISDLHKSEVRILAEYLKLPRIFLDAVPTGDMFDGCSDEAIFGATYDAVELHLNERQTDEAGKNLDKLHAYNHHKYPVGSPAVHLDIQESGVEGGWDIQFESKYWKDLKKQGDIIKPCFVSPMPFTKLKFDGNPCCGREAVGNIVEFLDLISLDETQQLLDLYHNSSKKEANIFGYTGTSEVVKSHRASLYNVELAEVLWKRMRPMLNLLQVANDPITDWKEGEIYRMVGISPLFRMIGYKDGGTLSPHYDYAFEDGEYKTLFSVVIYLTTNKTGGTRFLKDDQASSWNKNLEDRPDLKNAEIEKIVLTNAGNVVCFPHHLLHDSDIVVDEEKIIIRTDIVCQKILHS